MFILKMLIRFLRDPVSGKKGGQDKTVQKEDRICRYNCLIKCKES